MVREWVLLYGDSRTNIDSLPPGGRCPQRGRMRGQVKAQIRGRAGACPRRLFSFPFRECGEDFAACGRRVPLPMAAKDGGKGTKPPPGTRPMGYGCAYAPPRPIGRFPRTPLRGTPYREVQQGFRRAKSEWSPRFLPGHWALGLQKLPLLRFHSRAWLCRANVPGAVGAHIVRPPNLPLGGKVPQCAHWGG